jgi:hypothetical protein
VGLERDDDIDVQWAWREMTRWISSGLGEINNTDHWRNSREMDMIDLKPAWREFKERWKRWI